VYGSTEGTRELVAREKVTCYIGFDPTASSLHVPCSTGACNWT
jgi:tyrosyl-tRNA synthetase